jgi:outer membrane protein assembly factor BamD (BamD/ComL family)
MSRLALAPLLLAALLVVAAAPDAGATAAPDAGATAGDAPSARDRELADLYERLSDLYDRTPINYAAIIRLYERVVALAPGTEDAKGALAEIYHIRKDRGQWPGALATLDRLDRLYPPSETIAVGNEPTSLKAVILVERGLYFRDVARDYRRARAAFEALDARFPNATVTTDGFRVLGPEGYGGRAAPFARLALAEVEARARRHDVAEALLLGIIRAFPAEPLLLYEGESYFDEAALFTLRRQARQRGAPPPVAAYDRVAAESTHEYVRVRARELAAEAHLEAADALPPRDAAGRRAAYEAAIARYQKLIDHHPAFTFAFYSETEHLALKALDRIVEVAVKRLGNPGRAADECERVATRHAAVPDLAAGALFAKATLLATEGRDPAGAAAALHRLLDAYPDALRYPHPLDEGERLADAARAMLESGLASTAPGQ